MSEATSLYLAIMKVDLGSLKQTAPPLSEALVPAFASGPNYEAALMAAVAKLREMGHQFLDIQGQVQELDATQWSSYVRDVWSEFQSELPTEQEVRSGLQAGIVFFGPFVAYEAGA